MLGAAPRLDATIQAAPVAPEQQTPEQVATLPPSPAGFTADQATQLRREAAMEEQARLQEQAQIQQAEQQALQEQQQTQMARVAGLPGFTGMPDANQQIITQARANQAAQIKEDEGSRKAAINRVMKTTFSGDPIMQAIGQQKALEELGVPRAQAGQAAIKDKPELTYQQLQDAINKAEAADRRKGIKPITQKSTRLAPEELEAMGIQTQEKKKAPVFKAIEHPGNIGVDNGLIVEGATPFANKDKAIKARKLQPSMKVVKLTNNQYVLSPKTDAELERENSAARRLGIAQTGEKGRPLAAHEYIASEGGMSLGTYADLNIGENPKIGNRTLFQTNGNSIERATEKLIEAGYLPPTASQNDAYELISGSLQDPKFTPEGYERISEIAKEKEIAA